MRFSLTLDFIPVIPGQQHDIVLYIKRQLSKIGIDVRVRHLYRMYHDPEQLITLSIEIDPVAVCPMISMLTQETVLV
jgi:hypothetical protein